MDNPKLQEIFDILLLAGYFRVRIPSITIFDKILGGMTWCISCSNIDIDIIYNDDMSMGQKIKLAEEVIKGLKRMQCPFILYPHQIQGLDYENLYPVFQWLIKFVIETREYRQDFNKNMSSFLGGKFLKTAESETEKKIIKENIEGAFQNDRRLTKNSKILGFSKRDPLRIYSTLIEFDDKTAYKQYNKLCALIANKNLQNKGGTGSNAPLMKKQSLSVTKGNLQQQDNFVQGFVSISPGGVAGAGSNTMNMGNLANIAQMKGGNIANTGNIAGMGNNLGGANIGSTMGGGNLGTGNIAGGGAFGINAQGGNIGTLGTMDYNIFGEENVQQENLEILDENERGNFRKLERRQSKIGENLFKLVSENKDKITESLKAAYQETAVQDDEMEFATLIRNEKERHVLEVARINKKFEQNITDIEKMKENILSQDEIHGNLEAEMAEYKKNQEELEDTIAVIQGKIEDFKTKVSVNQMNKIQGLIDKKNQLKEKKLTIKKNIKIEMQDYEKEKKQLEQNAPQFSQELLENMASDLAKKKEKYDKKYRDFATLNQQIAVLQRKIEGCPPASEIAQYHQRIFELFDKITVEMEKYRMSFLLQNNYHDVKNVLLQNVDVMRVFKENYADAAKSKSKKEDFLKNLQATFGQLSMNQKKSVEVLDKTKTTRDKNNEDYTFLLHLEREYYKVLKELQMEYEKNEYFVEKLEENENNNN